VGVGFGVGRTVGAGVRVGTGVGRGVGPGVGRDSGPDVPPPDTSGGVTIPDGVGVAPATPPFGVGSIVGLGLTGAGLGVNAAVAEAEGEVGTGVGEAALDGITADDEGSLTAGVDDGRAAVSPPGGGVETGPPNAPTASASPARTRFRIPRATTSRARWAIVKRSGLLFRPGHTAVEGNCEQSRSYNASPGMRTPWAMRASCGPRLVKVERRLVKRDVAGGTAAGQALEEDQAVGEKRRLEV